MVVVESNLSRENGRVRRLVELGRSRQYRLEQRTYLLEGDRFVWEALERSQAPIGVYASGDLDGRAKAALIELCRNRDVAAYFLSESARKALSTLRTPANLFCEMAMANDPLAPPDPTSLSVVLDGVQDPGNVGTIIRSACAVGEVSVVVTRAGADPYAPKSARSSAQAISSVPIHLNDSVHEAVLDARGYGRQIVVFDGNAPKVLWEESISDNAVLVFGSEGGGVAQAVRDEADVVVGIPLSENSESLNVAVASSIVLFEIQRRRYAEGRRQRHG